MYSLKLPRNIVSGAGSLKELGTAVQGKYKNVAVFSDGGIIKSGIVDKVIEQLNCCDVQYEIIETATKEPTCDESQQIIDDFNRKDFDAILAVGGGSVMDLAKLTSILVGSEHSVRDLLESPLLGKRTIGLMMIPTTAGTGSEATPNSIVLVPEKELKVGIVNPEMIPDFVILDGDLIRDLPLEIAASTGIDALTHAIECYTSKLANPFSNLFAAESLKLIVHNIEKACSDKDSIDEKNNMLLAAFYAGIAITSSGTTAVHALSYPLGGKYKIPHGIANGMMLMPVMRFNERACQKELVECYDMLNLSGAKRIEEKSNIVLMRIEEIISNLAIPKTLRELHIEVDDIDQLVQSGMKVERLLKNNKRIVSPEDAKKIYQAIL
ncbi:MAG: iron-containing alcohol dehydrogenase [Clostridiales bacterium]|nr:iron-containing alcohol dehydrogenase [Clostridiales bacterium]